MSLGCTCVSKKSCMKKGDAGGEGDAWLYAVDRKMKKMKGKGKKKGRGQGLWQTRRRRWDECIHGEVMEGG